MKTKVIRDEGRQSLVVNDKEINDTCRFGSPIVLANITNYFSSLCWSYEDYRLSDNLIFSPYLNDSNDTIFNFQNYCQADKDLVLSKIKTYKIDENGNLFYWRYNKTDLNGDIPKGDSRRMSSGKEFPLQACFTFRAAQKKLKEAKEFWDNYEGSLTDEKIKLPNPHCQQHSASFYFDLEVNKQKLAKMKK